MLRFTRGFLSTLLHRMCVSSSQGMAIVLHVIAEINLLQLRKLNEESRCNLLSQEFSNYMRHVEPHPTLFRHPGVARGI